ncbi:STAS domain-containing protein [Streptomyces sp. NPDC058701]|uniref:STAS domain-containing protein n=1 Tax=Streptomyces sp. NPDC058701 TaxID=3346608 RepID=UPI00365330E0
MIGDEPVVTTTTYEGTTVVRLRGDLDQDSAPLLTRVLTEAAASGAPRTLVDLSRTRFADSSVLHALLNAHQAHTANGTALVLTGPLQVAVRRLFDVTGTGAAFNIADNLEDAMTW